VLRIEIPNAMLGKNGEVLSITSHMVILFPEIVE
jgi:hypothetical protein